MRYNSPVTGMQRRVNDTRLRRLLALLCAALVLAPAARAAADTCYSGFFDDYYHAAEHCALAGTVSAVTLREATEQGKLPCPACVDDDAGYGDVRAVVRGGTLVIRVPDRWMAERPASQMDAGFERFWSGEYTGRQAQTALAEQLHGAAYRAMLEGGADRRTDTARVPDIELDAEALLMNRRHIGAAWYLVYRPGEAARQALAQDGRLKIPLCFTVNTLTMQGSALNIYCGGLWRDGAFSLKPSKSSSDLMFEGDYGDGLSAKLLTGLEAVVCVIHRKDPPPDTLKGAVVLIDGADRGIRVDGYASDGDAVYCCVLDAAQSAALVDGAPLAIAPAADAD